MAGNKQALIWAYGSSDGGTTYTERVTGSDAAFTRKDPSNLKLVGTMAMPSNATIYQGTFAIANAFGGVLPQWWGIVVNNDSGVALSANAGNNKAFYQGLTLQYT